MLMYFVRQELRDEEQINTRSCWWADYFLGRWKIVTEIGSSGTIHVGAMCDAIISHHSSIELLLPVATHSHHPFTNESPFYLENGSESGIDGDERELMTAGRDK